MGPTRATPEPGEIDGVERTRRSGKIGVVLPETSTISECFGFPALRKWSCDAQIKIAGRQDASRADRRLNQRKIQNVV
ncbi:uncharacterized protein CIMG_03421 [Coccidioides immitis RS]|uniref:Uncharacterized protein n=1 Tax=Coccidioides immitis (strain RS) TaxID=246410 RepID=J3KBB5_COCIM|nr:uncharacterized protein CIMG_03421 [Coccidioides immitis RS]EAS32397.3 hypothetical protein CIMG_03421 [Coccidioides immitis RS]